MTILQDQILENIKKPLIKFFDKNGHVKVEIETSRLVIRSYDNSDFENCLALYGDPIVTKLFDFGKPFTKEEVLELVLEKGHSLFRKKIPLGLFSIFLKEDMSFVGQVDLMPFTESGTLEIGCILHRRYQGQGIGTEVVMIFLENYIDELNKRGYKYHGRPFKRVIATAHPKNVASNALIKHLGFTFNRFEERFGKPRLWYTYKVFSSSKNLKPSEQFLKYASVER